MVLGVGWLFLFKNNNNKNNNTKREKYMHFHTQTYPVRRHTSSFSLSPPFFRCSIILCLLGKMSSK